MNSPLPQPPAEAPDRKGRKVQKGQNDGNGAWHNALAVYLSRRVRHIRATSNEWVRVHRGGGGGGGNGDGEGWMLLLMAIAGVLFLAWGVYKVAIAIIAIITWIVGVIVAVLPYLIGIVMLAGLVIVVASLRR